MLIKRRLYMKFDFNEIIERSGKDAIAIDGI